MPKQEAMAQLSRPFQIALVAVVLLAGVWLFALQGHSTSTGGSGSSAAVSTAAPAPSTPAVTAKAQRSPSGKAAGATTHASHASGSSLGALSRPINLARHAAAVAEQHEAQIAVKSAQASNEAPAQTSSTSTHAPAVSATAAAPATKAAAKAVTKTATKTAVSPARRSAATPTTKSTASTKSAASTLSGQRAVEADLAKGDVVVLLFWNPAGADDATVHAALQSLADAHSRKIAVQYARANQVASFGSITRGVQVFATPTILVINKHGQTTVLTGVQDTFSVEQAIAEARSS